MALSWPTTRGIFQSSNVRGTRHSHLWKCRLGNVLRVTLDPRDACSAWRSIHVMRVLRTEENTLTVFILFAKQNYELEMLFCFENRGSSNGPRFDNRGSSNGPRCQVKQNCLNQNLSQNWLTHYSPNPCSLVLDSFYIKLYVPLLIFQLCSHWDL